MKNGQIGISRINWKGEQNNLPFPFALQLYFYSFKVLHLFFPIDLIKLVVDLSLRLFRRVLANNSPFKFKVCSCHKARRRVVVHNNALHLVHGVTWKWWMLWSVWYYCTTTLQPSIRRERRSVRSNALLRAVSKDNKAIKAPTLGLSCDLVKKEKANSDHQTLNIHLTHSMDTFALCALIKSKAFTEFV